MSYMTAPRVATAIVAVALTRLISAIIRNIFISPILTSVPGLFFARLTGGWVPAVDFSGSCSRTVHELRKRYGSVVRVGPKELSFSSVGCAKTIYGRHSTLRKSPAYDLVGRLGVFCIQDSHEHRQRHKRVAHIFAPAPLLSIEPLTQGVVSNVIRIAEMHLSNTIDMLHWCQGGIGH